VSTSQTNNSIKFFKKKKKKNSIKDVPENGMYGLGGVTGQLSTA
jgi:hypothetical protein